MTTYFFPSCKIRQQFPEQSRRLWAYLQSRSAPEPAACCRLDRKRPQSADTALVICNNCAAILEESSAAGRLQYVWELIDSDADFPFPDYHGERMTVQDCRLAADRSTLQEAVRSLLRKMNIVPVELAENRRNTRFCGAVLLSPCTPENARLAPRRYVQEGAEMFTPLPPERQAEHFRRHCRQIATEKTVCYCRPCVNGINAGGGQGLHLLELLFPLN